MAEPGTYKGGIPVALPPISRGASAAACCPRARSTFLRFQIQLHRLSSTSRPCPGRGNGSSARACKRIPHLRLRQAGRLPRQHLHHDLAHGLVLHRVQAGAITRFVRRSHDHHLALGGSGLLRPGFFLAGMGAPPLAVRGDQSGPV